MTSFEGAVYENRNVHGLEHIKDNNVSEVLIVLSRHGLKPISDLTSRSLLFKAKAPASRTVESLALAS